MSHVCHRVHFCDRAGGQLQRDREQVTPVRGRDVGHKREESRQEGRKHRVEGDTAGDDASGTP